MQVQYNHKLACAQVFLKEVLSRYAQQICISLKDCSSLNVPQPPLVTFAAMCVSILAIGLRARLSTTGFSSVVMVNSFAARRGDCWAALCCLLS